MNRDAKIPVTGMVRTANTVKGQSGSMLFNTVSEFVAEIIMRAPKNNQTKTTGAAIIKRTISPEVI